MNNLTKKRYWVFTGMVYYPEGGISDLSGTFDDIDTACDCVDCFLQQYEEDFGHKPDQYDVWFHIFDAVENKIVKEGL